MRAAAAIEGQDLEDDLQIACAVEAKLDAIVTRDTTGFAHSPIEVLTPLERLQRIDAITPLDALSSRRRWASASWRRQPPESIRPA